MTLMYYNFVLLKDNLLVVPKLIEGIELILVTLLKSPILFKFCSFQIEF